jgi:hypothetical protein
MARVMETVSTFNSLLRTLIALVVTALVCGGLWFGYQHYYAADLAIQAKDLLLADANSQIESQMQVIALKDDSIARLDAEVASKSQEIQRLDTEVAAQEVEIQQLDTAMRLLKMDHRLATLTVIDQHEDAETKQLQTRIEFVEVDDAGKPVGQPRTFDIQGDLVYIDHLIVKFKDEYVQNADVLRGTSICSFRRIFGEHQKPSEGFLLDEEGVRPQAYAGGNQPTPFERKIWDDFWNIANDLEKAQSLGIRAIHGDAVSIKLRPGKKWELSLRASSGLTPKPIEKDSSDLPAL